MKKVLYVAPSSGIGGAETFLLHTAEFHREFEPHYACFRPGPLVDRLRALGHEVHILPKPPRLSRPLDLLRSVRWLARLVRKEKIELVHSTMAYGALFGAPAAKLAGVPHCWFQHGPVGSWQDWIAARLPSALVITNSRYTLEQQRRLGSRRLSSLRLGVSAPPPRPAGERESLRRRLAAREFLSVVICRPQPQKGIELWIRATAELRRRGIDAAALLMGGSEIPSGPACLASELGVPFEWRPFGGSPWDEAQTADALVCSSISPEGYGLTLAEGSFHGLPVVAPREGGPLDLVEEGVNGVFFEPRNHLSLADALERLARDPGLRARLGEEGRRYAARNLSAEASIRELENQYLRLEAQ